MLLSPAAPQESEKVRLWVRGPTVTDPVPALGPDHPPDAVQAVPWVSQARTVLPPRLTDCGLAVIEACRDGGGTEVGAPPEPPPPPHEATPRRKARQTVS